MNSSATVDGNPTDPIAVRALQREGLLPKKVRWRCRAHGNNWIEQDHRGIKQRYYPMLGFQSFRSAKRFCRSFDELRHYFRPRRSPNQFVPSAQRRQQFKRKLAVL